MKLKRFFIFVLVILLLSSISVIYPRFTGKAVDNEYPKETAILARVIDGDTIELDTGEHVRLLGINTPEKKMPYSNESKNFLMQFENKTITLERDIDDADKYERKLRYIFYNSRFLNIEIIENGFANSYYASGLKYEQQILRAEEQARTNQMGIWKKSSETCAVQNCIIIKELNYTEEFFVIQNICNFDCNIDGWFVKDAGRNTFYLENLPSNHEQEYSSNSKEVWNNDGDRLFMFDEKGYLSLFYEYNP